MRVLHVIESGRTLLREFARARTELSLDVRAQTCRLIVEASADDHRVCLIGSAAAARRVLRLGVNPEHVVPPVLGRLGMAVGEMGRLLRGVRPDLVHVWNGEWTGGCIGRPGRAWRMESVLGATPLGLPFWLSSPQAFVCGPGETERAQAVGFDALPVDAPVLPDSGVERRTPSADSVRVLQLGPHADARKFVFLCTLLGQIGVTVCPIISASSGSIRRTRHFYRLIDRPLLATVTSRPLTELVQLCDLALWMGGPTGPCPASIRTAFAAGLPVIVPPSGAWAIPESLRSLLVARNTTSAELARLVQACAENTRAVREKVMAIGDDSNEGFLTPILSRYSGRHFEPPTNARELQNGAALHGAVA